MANWSDEEAMEALPEPAQTTDLNTIEHLERRITSRKVLLSETSESRIGPFKPETFFERLLKM